MPLKSRGADMPSQCDLIRWHLENIGPLTPLDALDRFGCFRLGARIYDLRRMGVPIASERVETPGGATVARYRLAQPQQGELVPLAGESEVCYASNRA